MVYFHFCIFNFSGKSSFFLLYLFHPFFWVGEETNPKSPIKFIFLLICLFLTFAAGECIFCYIRVNGYILFLRDRTSGSHCCSSWRLHLSRVRFRKSHLESLSNVLSDCAGGLLSFCISFCFVLQYGLSAMKE